MVGLDSSGENNGLQNSVLTCHGRYTTPTYRHIHAQEGIRTSYMHMRESAASLMDAAIATVATAGAAGEAAPPYERMAVRESPR